jgi:hypothetical protein
MVASASMTVIQVLVKWSDIAAQQLWQHGGDFDVIKLFFHIPLLGYKQMF